MSHASNWPVGLLSSAYGFERGDGDVTMAICAAYFRHEPANGDGLVRVVGLVAPKARWRFFEERWLRALRAAGLEGLSAGNPAPDLDRRVLEGLAHVVDQHVTRGFCCDLSVAACRTPAAASLVADAEAVCAARVIARLQRWMVDRRPGDLVVPVFEEGQVDHRQIRRALEAQGVTRGEPIQIWPRSWMDERGRTRRLRPFEACDLLRPDVDGGLIDRLTRRLAWEHEVFDQTPDALAGQR